MTIIVNSCDKFSDIWAAQIALLNKHWPGRPFRTILLTDTNSNGYSFNGIDVICAGKGTEIAQRLAFAIPLIGTKYVFMTLDDYFLTKDVASSKFGVLLTRMESDGIEYVRLFPDPRHKRKDKIKGERGMYRVDLNRSYSVNLYPGVWDVALLADTTTGPAKTVWQYEVSLTQKAKLRGSKGLVSLHDEYCFVDGVRKGKFLHKAYKYLKKNDLYSGTRGLNSRWYELKIGFKTFVSARAPKWMLDMAKKIGRMYGHTYFSDYSE